MGNASSFVESSRFEDLKAGDLIAIKMNGDLFEGRLTKFNHIGVYIGNGNVVHNRPGEGWMMKKGGGVEMCSFEEFLELRDDDFIDKFINGKKKEKKLFAWGKVVVTFDEYDALKSYIFSGEDTVIRAIHRIGEKNYHWKNNNSEHFARECRFGIPKSNQV